MSSVLCKAMTTTPNKTSEERQRKRPDSTLKVAQSSGVQQLIRRFRLFNFPLPLRLVQSKKDTPQTDSPPKQECIPCQRDVKKQRLAQDRVQFGRTVISLREFFPSILREDWPEEILADDVVLLDGITPRFNLNPFNAFGKKEYLRFMWLLRLNSFVLCKSTSVEVLRFWQPCKETIVVRWSVKIYPRLLYNISGTIVQIDGISEFKLNQRGKIYQHSIDISDHHNFKFDLHFQSFVDSRHHALTTASV